MKFFIAKLDWRDYLGLGLTILVVLLLVRGQQVADHTVCVQLNTLRAGFRDSLERGLNSIPTIQYYKNHPAEKKRALTEINRQIKLYKNKNC